MTTRLRRLHARHSIWNDALDDDAELAPTSANYVARLVRQTQYSPTSTPVRGPWVPPYTTVIAVNDYTVPIYVMPEDTPRVKVTYKYLGVPQSENAAYGLQTKWNAVPVPDRLLCKPGTNRPSSVNGQIESEGTDASVAFICGSELWEFWRFMDDPAEDDGFSASYGGYHSNIYTSMGCYRNGWGVRASGTTFPGGLITAEDEEAGTINHALAVQVACSGAGSSTPVFISPFIRGDTASHLLTELEAGALHADRLPHGARFRLPFNFDTEGWVDDQLAADSAVNPQLLTAMCESLRIYGMYVTDSTGGTISFCAEDGRTFDTPYNPWEERPAGLGDLTNLNANRRTCMRLPWSSLQQVAVPPSPWRVRRLVHTEDGVRKLVRN